MKKKLIRVWKQNAMFRQASIAIAVVICALLLVFVVDVLSHPGRSWNESMVIKMILIRRAGD